MNKILTLARNNLKVANCLVEANDADLLNSACSEISVAIELCLRYLLTGREIQDAQPYSIVILISILMGRGYLSMNGLYITLKTWNTGKLIC